MRRSRVREQSTELTPEPAAPVDEEAAKRAWLGRLEEPLRRAGHSSGGGEAANEATNGTWWMGNLSERCNVVLTHTNADFDSLAGAVALAKLWGVERPELPTHVVLPRGVNPIVARFLAYHKHLLPIRGFKTIREQDVAAVGVVDTQSIDRVGPAAQWLHSAEHVAVVDHHLGVMGID